MGFIRAGIGLLVTAATMVGVTKVAAEEPVLELPVSNHGGLIIVPIDIGHAEGLDFVLDSGSVATTVNDIELAQELGLHTRFLGIAEGFGGARLPVLSAPDVAVESDGSLLMRTDLVVHHVVELQEPAAGRSLHGLLGADLFARYAVDIDPDAGVVRLHPRGTRPPFEPVAEASIVVSRGRPLVEARITLEGGRSTSATLLLDTGAEGSLLIVHGAKRRLKPPKDGATVQITGIGGTAPAVMARVETLELGGVVLGSHPAAFIEREALPTPRRARRVDGILGNGFLRGHRTWIDFSTGRLVLGEQKPSTDDV
jgi:hypothetical protein